LYSLRTRVLCVTSTLYKVTDISVYKCSVPVGDKFTDSSPSHLAEPLQQILNNTVLNKWYSLLAHQISLHVKFFCALNIVTCYLLTRRIISGLRILYLGLLDITSGGVYNHLYHFQLHHMNQQLLLVLYLSQAGANHFWGCSVTNCSWWVHIPDCCDNQCFTHFIVSANHC
jgi:hypothetical protein